MFSPCLSIKGYSYLFGKGIYGVCVFRLVWDLKQSVWRNARLLLWHPSLFLFTCLCLSICLSFSFSLCPPSLTPSNVCHFYSLSSSILLLFLVSLLASSFSHSHPFYLALKFLCLCQSREPFLFITIKRRGSMRLQEQESSNGWKEERLWAVTQFDGSFHEFSMSTES